MSRILIFLPYGRQNPFVYLVAAYDDPFAELRPRTFCPGREAVMSSLRGEPRYENREAPPSEGSEPPFAAGVNPSLDVSLRRLGS